MRFEGTITTWKENEGYGFITPTAGGKEVFVHIKSLANRRRRPRENDVVTFELGADTQGRPQAQRVAYADEKDSWPSLSRRSYTSLALVTAFFAFLTGATFARRLPFAVVGLYAVTSAIAFALYAIDKSAAKHGRWRTQEMTLQFWALIGGWPGAIVAQTLLRHKTKKLSFQIVFWIMVVLNGGALLWALSPTGAPILRRMVDSVGPNF